MARLLIGLVLLTLLCAGWVFGMQRFYDDKAFVSAETMKIINTDLMVTAENRQELNRSKRFADEIAFGLLGLIAGAVIAACTGRFSTQANLIKAGVIGAVAGLLTGAAAGYIGHAFQNHVNLVENSTVHSVIRLIAMFLPFAIAIGLTAAMSGNFQRDVADSVVSAILGLLIAAAIYGLASDSIQGFREEESQIMPHHLSNRIILSFVVSMLISLMISAQMLRKPKGTVV